MSSSDTLPLHIVGAIRTYLGAGTEDRPVSIDRVLRTARQTAPDLPVSDEELAELIARELIQEGCDVDFDLLDANERQVA